MHHFSHEQLPPQPVHEGIRTAAEFFDRQIMEAEARQLIEQREQLPAIEVMTQERQDNARTALMEALTASGHLSLVEIHGTFEEINAQVMRRLLNGWDESLPQHEKDRRFAEICNELLIQRTLKAVVTGELPPDTEIVEISDYPEALRGYKLGYRDSNKKGMVRSSSLRYNENGQYTRVIETASRSNSSWTSTFSFLEACRTQTENKPPDIAALEAPHIYTRSDYVNGVVDVMRLLDRHAGAGTLYGDTGDRISKHPTYENLRVESARREQEILGFVNDLARLEQQLDGWVAVGKLTQPERLRLFTGEVQRILDAICTLEPSYAEDTFGKRSAAIFEQAANLVAQGRHKDAAALLESHDYLKQTVTFCGMSISVEKAKEMGLQVNSYGQLVEKGTESWKWKRGICVVKTCSTRPSKTEVGPCSVCRKCQAVFDRGKDPTKGSMLFGPKNNEKGLRQAV